jgi:hypothetical protein
VIDALLLEAPRNQGRAVDFAHGFPLCDLLFFGPRLCIDGGVAKVQCVQPSHAFGRCWHFLEVSSQAGDIGS